jgi:hypothetical protein
MHFKHSGFDHEHKGEVMDTEDLEIICLELKYCERCGSLWMRTQGTGEVYCPNCALEMLDLPAARRERPPRLLLVSDDRVEIKSQAEVWLAVYGEWGNA